MLIMLPFFVGGVVPRVMQFWQKGFPLNSPLHPYSLDSFASCLIGNPGMELLLFFDLGCIFSLEWKPEDYIALVY